MVINIDSFGRSYSNVNSFSMIIIRQYDNNKNDGNNKSNNIDN